eukprot:1178496-Prorocentrum_minimum.AAC.1
MDHKVGVRRGSGGEGAGAVEGAVVHVHVHAVDLPRPHDGAAGLPLEVEPHERKGVGGAVVEHDAAVQAEGALVQPSALRQVAQHLVHHAVRQPHVEHNGVPVRIVPQRDVLEGVEVVGSDLLDGVAGVDRVEAGVVEGGGGAEEGVVAVLASVLPVEHKRVQVAEAVRLFRLGVPGEEREHARISGFADSLKVSKSLYKYKYKYIIYFQPRPQVPATAHPEHTPTRTLAHSHTKARAM